MNNLLNETLTCMEGNDLAPEDVLYVGSLDGEYAIGWDDFEDIAEHTNYDSGFGSQEIAEDLCIRFRDGSTMIRMEYDGSEWWSFIPPVNRNYSGSKPFRRLMCDGSGYASLKEINSPLKELGKDDSD